MITVAAIIVILVGLFIIFKGPGGIHRVDRTRMSMRIAMNAIDYYYEQEGKWPFSSKINTTSYDPLGRNGPQVVYGYTDRLVRDMDQVKGAKERLKNMPAGTLKTANVPRDQFDDCNDPWGNPTTQTTQPALPLIRDQSQQRSLRATAIVDGWDRPMLYLYNGSREGKPVLVSAGPDGRFGPQYYYFKNWGGDIGWRTYHETDPKYGEDDITSDSMGK